MRLKWPDLALWREVADDVEGGDRRPVDISRVVWAGRPDVTVNTVTASWPRPAVAWRLGVGSRRHADALPTRRLVTAQHALALLSTGLAQNLGLCSTIAHGELRGVTAG